MNVPTPIRPHDLLWGLSVAALPADAPAWLFDVIEQGHPVVVRRGQVAAGWIAVGVRGRVREQRFATQMPSADITRRVIPEQLTDVCADPGDGPALSALRQIHGLMNALQLPWGVTGSAGFQLATGVPVLHQDSDLDLILRAPEFFTRERAARLSDALAAAACRIDLQLQTPSGAVALREWAGSSRQVLLKADDGARLVSNPWLPEERAA